VRVGDVRISLATGEGRIRKFSVANPSGFPEGEALALDEISVALDLESLSGSPIVVKELRIAAPVVHAVVDEQGRTNFDVIRENAKRYAESDAGDASGSRDPGESPPTLLRIDVCRFQDGRIAADLTNRGGKKIETDLPPIELRSVGGAQGSEPAEVGKTVAVALSRAVAAAITRSGAELLIDEKLGGEAGEAVKTLLRRIIR